MSDIEELRTATSLLPDETDETELSIVLDWVKTGLNKLDFENNQADIASLLTELNIGIRCVEHYSGESKRISKLLSKPKFIKFLDTHYQNPESEHSTLAIETFYSLGYLLAYRSKQSKRIYKLIGKNPELAKKYLYKPETSAMMLQILITFQKLNPKLWQSDKPLQELIEEFLFTGSTTTQEFTTALTPIDTPAWTKNLRYQNYILQMIGFSYQEIEKIMIDGWDSVYSEIDTLYESIMPNLLSIIFLESELPGAARTLHQIYGIRNFARNTIEQYIKQIELYERILEGKKSRNPIEQKIVLALNIDNDNSGALLGKRDTLWANTRKILEGENIQLIIAETGESLENFIAMLEKIREIHGPSEQIILSIHASETGLLLYYGFEYEIDEKTSNLMQSEGSWVEINHQEIKEKLTPELIKSLTKNGSLILNICHANHYEKNFPGVNVIRPHGDGNSLIDMKKTKHRSKTGPLQPVFYEYSKVGDSTKIDWDAERN